MQRLLALDTVLRGHNYNSNIDTSEGTAQLPLRDGIPYLEVSSKYSVLSFHEASHIANWVRDCLNDTVHLHCLTGNSIAFYVFDSKAEYTEAHLQRGTFLPTWLRYVNENHGKDLPAPPGLLDHDTVLPSQAYDYDGFIWKMSSDFCSDDSSGKWCIVRSASEVDALWKKVREAVDAGVFPAALVSTPHQAMGHGGSFVICVFTLDWRNLDDVNAARTVLRSYGVTEEIGYKRDIETFNNVYGVPEEWFYRA